jgi:hypothetical protein
MSTLSAADSQVAFLRASNAAGLGRVDGLEQGEASSKLDEGERLLARARRPPPLLSLQPINRFPIRARGMRCEQLGTHQKRLSGRVGVREAGEAFGGGREIARAPMSKTVGVSGRVGEIVGARLPDRSERLENPHRL